MINIADRPEIQVQIEEAERQAQQAAEAAPQYARAPAGNGHEAAIQGGAR